MTTTIDQIENFVGTEAKDVEAFFAATPASVKLLVTKLETDAGKMVQTAAETAAADIVAGGIFNTAAYVKAGLDIWAQVPDDSELLLSDVFAILNAEVSALPATASASVNTSA